MNNAAVVARANYYKGMNATYKTFKPVGNWCLEFINQVLKDCGATIELTASCTQAQKIAESKNLWHRGTDGIRDGDILFFQGLDDIPRDYDHVAIVEKLNGDYIHTIEGNTGMGDYRMTSINTYAYHRNRGILGGYIRTSDIVNEYTEPSTGDKRITCEARTLRKGCKGVLVTMLQTFLILNNYDCGTYGADGDFGDCTTAAVKKYQAAHDLKADGIVGTMTWSRILTSEV